MLFIDNGHSGASLIRPALERLRDLVALSARRYSSTSMPRIASPAATPIRCCCWKNSLAPARQVVFLNRPIGDTPEDSLLLQLQGMFAEYERAKVLERSRRGKRHRAQAGAVSVLSRAPFGYRYITREAGGGDARYEIDEDAARIVRQIFTWVGHERLTLAAVCRRLHAAGIPSPAGQGALEPGHDPYDAAQPGLCRSGHLWSPPVPAVAGRRCIRRAATTACRSGPTDKFRRRLSGTSACAVPAIVDEALFASAAEQLRGEPKPQSRAAGGRAIPAARSARLPEVRLWVHRPPPSGAVALLSMLRHRSQPLPRRSSVAMPGWLRSSRSMRPCGPRSAGCWKTRRWSLRSTSGGWTRCRPSASARARCSRPSASPRRAARSIALIDSYAEGLIEKPEFEPRIAELRRRAARLEAEAKAQQAAEEQVRSLQRVIGKSDLFAAMVHDRLAGADWSTKRDIICTLVKRIEVADDAFGWSSGLTRARQALRTTPKFAILSNTS